MRPETLARAVRPLGMLGVPGFHPLIVEPLHRRGVRPPDGPLESVVHGAEMELDLSDYVQRRLFYGTYENSEARVVRRLLRAGDVAIDVGANVGFFTLLAATSVGPTGSVLAVEPVPANADALDRNLLRNGVKNVAVARAAVGASTGTTTLGLSGTQNRDGERGRDGTSGHYTVGGTDHAVDVPLTTLDDLVARVNQPIRFIKLDIEGQEAEALAGFGKTLSERPPYAVLIEENAAATGKHSDSGSGLACDLLLGLGYHLSSIGVGGRVRKLRRGGVVGHLGAVRNILALRDDGSCSAAHDARPAG